MPVTVKDPEEVCLGEYEESVNGKRQTIRDVYFWVPLLKSLKELLRSQTVREQVYL